MVFTGNSKVALITLHCLVAFKRFLCCFSMSTFSFPVNIMIESNQALFRCCEKGILHPENVLSINYLGLELRLRFLLPLWRLKYPKTNLRIEHYDNFSELQHSPRSIIHSFLLYPKIRPNACIFTLLFKHFQCLMQERGE